jgi:hypothetical protein
MLYKQTGIEFQDLCTHLFYSTGAIIELYDRVSIQVLEYYAMEKNTNFPTSHAASLFSYCELK